MIRLGLGLYLSIGLIWGIGVTVVRLLVDGPKAYPRPSVWVPMTILAWPWSMYISAREFVRGVMGQ